MPSPFPGMNPYLEQEDVWHDFHERFLPVAAELLLPQVRPKYIIRLDEHAYIHELPASDRRLVGRPDIGIVERPGTERPAKVLQTTAAPIDGELPLAVDVERQAFLEVRDKASRELVTVIELLSPSNKRFGGDRDQCLGKRRDFTRSPAHLVELDLLRGGPRLPLEPHPPTDYYAMVSRAGERPRVGIWPIGLREKLPNVPIPLRPGDPDATLDLRHVLDRVYDAAGYDDYIYDGSPQPPLSDSDAAWASEVLAAVGH